MPMTEGFYALRSVFGSPAKLFNIFCMELRPSSPGTAPGGYYTRFQLQRGSRKAEDPRKGRKSALHPPLIRGLPQSPRRKNSPLELWSGFEVIHTNVSDWFYK